MSIIHHQNSGVNSSVARKIRLASEQVLMLQEAKTNPDGFVVAQELEVVTNLSRSTTLKYAAQLVKYGLFRKGILSGTENKYKPTSTYALNIEISEDAIRDALYSGILIISEEGEKATVKEDSQELNAELEQNFSSFDDASAILENKDKLDGILSLESSCIQLEELNTNEQKAVTLNEVLEVFEETTRILMDKIAQQDERIAELEKQLSVFKATSTSKDPRKVLCDVRSRFNSGVTPVVNGNGCRH